MSAGATATATASGASSSTPISIPKTSNSNSSDIKALALQNPGDIGTGDDSHISLDQPFQATRCLFCNKERDGIEDNLSHMLEVHGLYIPEHALLVDLETLLSYCHLVISGYFECLYCGTQRNSANAVQRHMNDKGHCRIDVTDDSEFNEFFDPQLLQKADNERNATAEQLNSGPVLLDNTTLRLSSGKLLAHRSVHTPRIPRQHTLRNENRPGLSTVVASDEGLSSSRTDSEPHDIVDNLGTSPPQTMSTTRTERRASALTNQLEHLRGSDRSSLMHLPLSQQRAILAASKRRMNQAIRVDPKTREGVVGCFYNKASLTSSKKVYIGGG